MYTHKFVDAFGNILKNHAQHIKNYINLNLFCCFVTHRRVTSHIAHTLSVRDIGPCGTLVLPRVDAPGNATTNKPEQPARVRARPSENAPVKINGQGHG